MKVWRWPRAPRPSSASSQLIHVRRHQGDTVEADAFCDVDDLGDLPKLEVRGGLHENDAGTALRDSSQTDRQVSQLHGFMVETNSTAGANSDDNLIRGRRWRVVILRGVVYAAWDPELQREDDVLARAPSPRTPPPLSNKRIDGCRSLQHDKNSPASLRSDFIHIASERSIHIVGIRNWPVKARKSLSERP